MDSAANVFRIDDYRERRAHQTSTAAQNSYAVDTSVSEVSPPTSQNRATLDDLYADGGPSTALLLRARELLKKCEGRIANAQRLFLTGDQIGADDEVSLFQADLPELFLCSEISEGLTATIVALHHALLNRRGMPLTADQYASVKRAIQLVHDNVFLPLGDEVLEIIDGLLQSGLRTDPIEADHLSDTFIE